MGCNGTSPAREKLIRRVCDQQELDERSKADPTPEIKFTPRGHEKPKPKTRTKASGKTVARKPALSVAELAAVVKQYAELGESWVKSLPGDALTDPARTYRDRSSPAPGPDAASD